MPRRTYQWSVVTASAKSSSDDGESVNRYEVVREPGWPVTVIGEVCPNRMVTATSACGGSRNPTGSDTAVAPGAIVTSV